MNSTDYDNAMFNMLNNSITYSSIPSDPSLSINSDLNAILKDLHGANILSDDVLKCIVNDVDCITCPHFYGIPKLHKPESTYKFNLPPFRGIIASVSGPNTRASIWLDHILNPLVPQYCGSEYCKDSPHILSDLQSLNSSLSFPPSDYCLLTIDVVDMYNSIPHADGLLACKDALSSMTSFSTSQINLILKLISFILSNNCFSFKDSFYRQQCGTAMGSPFAPAYANIFMAYFWRTKVTPSLPSVPVFFRRYIDDMFGIFDSDLDPIALDVFLNSLHPTVKFTLSTPSLSVPFLDLTIHIFDSKIHTDLYCKPTDSHQFLSPLSNHPPHVFYSIVYGAALRLLRICSRESYLIKRLSELFNHLTESQYKPSFIKPIFEKVLKKSRSDALSKKSHKPNQSRPIYVTTFHPQKPNLHSLHAANEQILKKSDRMSTILPDRPLVAYRRTPNLQNILIKTKPRSKINCLSADSHESNPDTSSPSQIPTAGCRLCTRPNCALCRHHLQPGARITSSVTKNSYQILSNSHCNSANLIYVITCNKCNKQYTGQTSNKLRLRFNNHKAAIKKPNTDESVALHFRQPDHSVMDLKINIVETLPSGPDIRVRLNKAESAWMHRLKTHRITGGHNVDEPFFNNLTFSN